MISVIIPVYNVENYLVKCLDSVINQTYNDLEIILIDDGSADSSGSICDKYAARDSRVKVVHQENRGLSSARNKGLELCSGELISFVDSDDYLDKDMLDILEKTLRKYDADIVQCEINRIYLNRVEKGNNTEVSVFSGAEAVKSLLLEERIRFEVWNKLYKKTCIDDYSFKIGQVHEDIYFTPRVLLNSNQVVCIGDHLYNYLAERAGNTNSSFKKNRLDVFDEFNSLIDLFINKNYSELSELAKVLALKYCMTFYTLAYKNHAELDIKERLLTIYNHYLNAVNSSYLDKKFKIYLFKIHPNFYSKLFLLKENLKHSK